MFEFWEFALLCGLVVVCVLVRSRRATTRACFQFQAMELLLERERAKLIEMRREQQRVLLRAKGEESAFRQSKERFFEVVSHELRTPLSSIVASVEILLDEVERESSAMEWVQIANESTLRLTRTVERVEELVHLESDAERTGFEVVNLEDVVARLQDRVQKREDISDVACRMTWPARAVGVEVHGTQLTRMIELLIENALRFSPPGSEVCLDIECVLAIDEDKDRVRISVVDCGPGVPIEQRRAIFDSFHQVRNGLSDKPLGMGLGLTICTAIAGNFGCRILVENRDPVGSRFFFELPCRFRNRDERIDAVGESPMCWRHQFGASSTQQIHALI